jgi:YjbE family integral membrane protein
MALDQPTFWLLAAQIIWINILLSGDNAVVIAMACRGLSGRKRLWGTVLGAGVAILLRIVFTGVVSQLMETPFLKIAGGLALLWIAAKLVVPEDESGNEGDATESLMRAVWIVAIADVVMSLDNVIAIAAVARGNWYLLIFGLAVSIPLIIAGSTLLMAVLDRFPLLVWAGAGLLGWIAGELFVTDPYIHHLLPPAQAGLIEWIAAVTGVAVALGFGWLLRRRKEAAHRPERTEAV